MIVFMKMNVLIKDPTLNKIKKINYYKLLIIKIMTKTMKMGRVWRRVCHSSEVKPNKSISSFLILI